MSDAEVSDAQALKTVLQVLGPIKIIYRGDTNTYNESRDEQWRTACRQWAREQTWHGQGRRRSW